MKQRLIQAMIVIFGAIYMVLLLFLSIILSPLWGVIWLVTGWSYYWYTAGMINTIMDKFYDIAE